MTHNNRSTSSTPPVGARSIKALYKDHPELFVTSPSERLRDISQDKTSCPFCWELGSDNTPISVHELLYRHLTSYHADDQALYQCDICFVKLLDRRHVDQHRNTHIGAPPKPHRKSGKNRVVRDMKKYSSGSDGPFYKFWGKQWAMQEVTKDGEVKPGSPIIYPPFIHDYNAIPGYSSEQSDVSPPSSSPGVHSRSTTPQAEVPLHSESEEPLQPQATKPVIPPVDFTFNMDGKFTLLSPQSSFTSSDGSGAITFQRPQWNIDSHSTLSSYAHYAGTDGDDGATSYDSYEPQTGTGDEIGASSYGSDGWQTGGLEYVYGEDGLPPSHSPDVNTNSQLDTSPAFQYSFDEFDRSLYNLLMEQAYPNGVIENFSEDSFETLFPRFIPEEEESLLVGEGIWSADSWSAPGSENGVYPAATPSLGASGAFSQSSISSPELGTPLEFGNGNEGGLVNVESLTDPEEFWLNIPWDDIDAAHGDTLDLGGNFFSS